jgi:hypothetical protein
VHNRPFCDGHHSSRSARLGRKCLAPLASRSAAQSDRWGWLSSLAWQQSKLRRRGRWFVTQATSAPSRARLPPPPLTARQNRRAACECSGGPSHSMTLSIMLDRIKTVFLGVPRESRQRFVRVLELIFYSRFRGVVCSPCRSGRRREREPLLAAHEREWRRKFKRRWWLGPAAPRWTGMRKRT